jgi:hypothetical protein
LEGFKKNPTNLYTKPYTWVGNKSKLESWVNAISYIIILIANAFFSWFRWCGKLDLSSPPIISNQYPKICTFCCNDGFPWNMICFYLYWKNPTMLQVWTIVNSLGYLLTNSLIKKKYNAQKKGAQFIVTPQKTNISISGNTSVIIQFIIIFSWSALA